MVRQTAESFFAKPQVTVEIAKNTLTQFTDRLALNQVYYRSGRDMHGEAFSKSNVPIVFLDSVKQCINIGFVLINSLLQDPQKNVESARALAKIAWHVMVCASLRDGTQYYKARFPVMPRTSIFAAYEKLDLDNKEFYLDLVENLLRLQLDLVLPAIKSWSKANSYPFEDALNSTYDYNFTKTKVQSPQLSKQVEITASDEVASDGDVGKSVGNMDLPTDSDGIFEIRGMPYIKIDTPDEVKSIYEDVLMHYSGKQTPRECFD